MSSPFVGEIRMMGFNLAPKGWAFCDGQLMSISQNTALFSLLGTYYGGDGRSTFGLPDLQGMSPMQQGQGQGLSQRFVGETSGESSVTLLQSEMPQHPHTINTYNSGGDNNDPTSATYGAAMIGRQGTNLFKAAATNAVQMHPLALALAGGSLPHNNMPPYLTVNFCIALQGVYPPRT
jgi:microcystin-dependent protein